MNIREPTPGETDVINQELLLPGFCASEDRDPEFNELDEAGLNDSGCEYWLGDEEKTLFVAEIDDELVGYASAGTFENAPIYARGLRAHADGLYVKEAHRRQGIASALVDQVEQWAKEMNCEYLGVTVHAANENAKTLYEDKLDLKYLSYRQKIE